MLNLSASSSTTRFSSQNPNPCYRLHSLNSISTTISLFTHNPNSISLTSTKPRKLSLKSRQSEYFEKGFAPNNSSKSLSDPQQSSGLSPKVFVGHTIYKGKAALTVEPKPPEFSFVGSGCYKLAREGYLLLQFAPAASVRQYDWSRKQVFSLSVAEMGIVMSLGAKDSCEFYHDPNKGRSDEGKVRKVLKVEPLPDGSGHFFKLGVQNRLINMDESIYIPVSKAEYTILMSAFNFIVPYLIGWHAFGNTIRPEDDTRPNSANSRAGADHEWNR